ncbi:hypothetical protein HKX48_006248 [Thoreauomyces humboldtii]|nr:hypothetical protein HKX48_006248 [Thoreauomyces humboldtii]
MRYASKINTHGLGAVRYQDFKRILRETPISLERLIAGEPGPDDGGGADADFIAVSSVPLAKLAQEGGSVSLQEKPRFTEETARLNKRLGERPNDLAAWTELIKLQDDLIRPDDQAKMSLLTAVNEKRQSIYEAALREFPNNVNLLSGYMRVCQELWDTATLLTRWDRILKSHSHSITLWKQYLDFRQTNSSTFTVTSCIELYETCIDIMRSDIRTDMERREEILLHALTRACSLLAQSGFIERAVALYQAMIEFNCFCPPAFTTQSYEQRMGMFEGFWDSELPRFGEEGALGWASSLMQDPSSMDFSCLPEGDFTIGNADPISAFHREETIREFHNWLPLRGSEDDEPDDPYRAVLYEDVSTLMFEATLPQTRHQLVHNLLHLLAVQLNSGVSSNAEFFQDPFVHSEHANYSAANLFWPVEKHALQHPTEVLSTEQGQATLESDPFSVPIKTYPQSTSTTFGASAWFRQWTPQDAKVFQDSGFQRKEFVRNIFLQSQNMLASIPDLMPLLIAFESGCDGFSGTKRAQKTAKSLLSTDRMNLSLWNAFAQTEIGRGKTAEARKVYETALSSYRSFPAENQRESPLLYFMMADMEYQAGFPDKSLSILVHFALDETGQISEELPKPTVVLKARKALGQRLEILVASASGLALGPNERALLDALSCYGLLEYLAQGWKDAQRIYEQVLDSLRARDSSPTVLEEVVFEEYIRLLFQHARSGATFKPGLMRDIAERGLARFPCNILILTMYGWNEARTKMDNRVRRLLDLQLSKSPSHILWTFAIWAELHQRQVYNVNLVRSLFERALACPSSKHSVSLWYLYIQFEQREGDLGKVKTLFFRAIQECPWKLYMLPFHRIRAAFDDDEVKDIVNLMEEKELRVRTTLEA